MIMVLKKVLVTGSDFFINRHHALFEKMSELYSLVMVSDTRILGTLRIINYQFAEENSQK